jgi:glycosyltransferase involved in cell wall biosynthesis
VVYKFKEPTMQEKKSSTSRGLDIIIPVYNESEVICKTLKEISEKIEIPHNILIIYDFDEDTTLPAVREYITEKNSSNIYMKKNIFGKGALNAIKSGFKLAESESVLVVMGDASDDLVAVKPMYEKISSGCDVVCGSRYMQGGKQIGGPLFKKSLSKLAGLSLNFIAGVPVHDITNSFKMYRRSLLDSIKIESKGGFEIGMEIVVKAYLEGYNICEVPSVWRDRSDGKSNFKLFKWLPHYLKWYFLALFGKKKRIR